VKADHDAKPGRRREKALGDYGEARALQALSACGFEVEKMPRNFPFFDLMARRGTTRLLVSVRTRNKFTSRGALKHDNYNLYTKAGHFESAAKIAKFFDAKIQWVAVTVDTRAKTCSVYTGDVDQLPSPRYIPMHPTRDRPKHKCLADEIYDDEISESWSNINRTVAA
jgi:Holliday junction resolvase-like predicted endonuclease